jgi:hypothetical protein
MADSQGSITGKLVGVSGLKKRIERKDLQSSHNFDNLAFKSFSFKQTSTQRLSFFSPLVRA